MKLPPVHKYDHVGPGGRGCSCCYPAPGKARKLYERSAKRRMNKEISKEIEQELMAAKDTVKVGFAT